MFGKTREQLSTKIELTVFRIEEIHHLNKKIVVWKVQKLDTLQKLTQNFSSWSQYEFTASTAQLFESNLCSSPGVKISAYISDSAPNLITTPAELFPAFQKLYFYELKR